MNNNPGNNKAAAHLEVCLEHGIPRKIVLKNVWKTLNATVGGLYFTLTHGKPLKYFNQTSYKILLISYIILMAEERRDWGGGARLKFGTSVRLYLFIFLTSLEYYDHCALFYSESRVYVSLSLKHGHFATLKWTSSQLTLMTVYALRHCELHTAWKMPHF